MPRPSSRRKFPADRPGHLQVVPTPYRPLPELRVAPPRPRAARPLWAVAGLGMGLLLAALLQAGARALPAIAVAAVTAALAAWLLGAAVRMIHRSPSPTAAWAAVIGWAFGLRLLAHPLVTEKGVLYAAILSGMVLLPVIITLLQPDPDQP